MRLVVSDIDGTLAQPTGDPWDNGVQILKQHLDQPETALMFCTARPKQEFAPAWAWLNRHLRLTASGKRCSLVCRPEEIPDDRIPAYKLSELVHAIRRYRPDQLSVYDSDVRNLRLFGTLAPQVPDFRLFRADQGVVARWTL